MLFSQEMNNALNEQIGNEFASSLQYVAVAAHFDRESLPELAAFFYRQADEERMHAMKFVKYVADAGGTVIIPALGQPVHEFATAEAAAQIAYDSELKVTRQINGLVDLAIREADHLSSNFLQWFVTEQLEEVSSMSTLLSIIKRAGESGLLIVEQYLMQWKPNAMSGAEAPAT